MVSEDRSYETQHFTKVLPGPLASALLSSFEGIISECTLDSHTLHKKWSFPLRLSSVNMTKSAVSCRFGHIYWRNHNWKTSLFAQCKWYGSQKKNSKEVKKLYINWQSSNNWANLEFFRYNLEFFSIFSFFSFLLHLLLLFFFLFLPFLLLFFCYFWKCN